MRSRQGIQGDRCRDRYLNAAVVAAGCPGVAAVCRKARLAADEVVEVVWNMPKVRTARRNKEQERLGCSPGCTEPARIPAHDGLWHTCTGCSPCRSAAGESIPRYR